MKRIESRRELLKSSLLSGAGLFIAFHVPSKARAADPKPKAPPDPNAFVRVAPDGTVPARRVKAATAQESKRTDDVLQHVLLLLAQLLDVADHVPFG